MNDIFGTAWARTRVARFRATALSSILVMLAVLVPAVALTASPASAASTYDGLSFRLQGCDLPVATVLPISGKFICPDADYSDGNLGKNWNELDLVPHRILINAGNSAPASQTYTFQIAADNLDSGHTGYDFIENGFEATSSACQNVSIGSQQTAGTNPQYIYRNITVTQAKNTTCQLDLYIRLGVGAHLYPGSSLHSNLLNDVGTEAGIGNKENSIPVNEIEPQSINKDMAAAQDQDTLWGITKTPTPANLDFGDTCAGGSGPFTKTVAIKVDWTNLGTTPSGQIDIVTHVYATNPSHRTITVNVSDDIRSGTTVLDTATSGAVDVPANTANFPVLTHQTSVPSGTTALNDVATATYTDKVTGIPVPGTTTATASASVVTGTVNNATVDLSDTESITGTGLDFAVATPSVGSFTGGYTAGTYTTGPVGWELTGQTTSGSVTFNKTVRLDQPRITSGTLSDTATVSSGGQFLTDADLEVGITSSASASIKVSKTIDVVLGASDGAETFTFQLKDGATLVDTKTITFNVGDGASAKTATFTGLTPGTTYTVHEVPSSYGYGPASDQNVTVTLPSCSETVSFANQHGPATAQVKKVTDPAGSEAGWKFTLNGPGGGETVTTTGTGYISFATALQEGSYTITETGQSGWDSDGGSASCSFSVNYPADADKVFSCTFTNTKRGEIDLIKLFNGVTPTGTQTFTFDLRTGASAGNAGTIVQGPVTLNSGNGWAHNFTNLVPGTYQLCESGVPAGGHSTLEDMTGAFVPNPADNSTVCAPVTVGAGGKVQITVNDTPPPGGDSRTIGYWKNWASCTTSSAKKAPVLDQTLYKAGSITIGTLVLHGGTANVSPDCAKAVKILSKKSLDGTKKASDPLFNMAAQLLAADLNVAAGAKTCLAATNAINAAQALLVKYGWNGQTYSPKLTAADKNLANSLASTLDKYNNNKLC
jgi:hypothetical protein